MEKEGRRQRMEGGMEDCKREERKEDYRNERGIPSRQGGEMKIRNLVSKIER